MARTARRSRPTVSSRRVHPVRRCPTQRRAPRPRWWSLYVGVAIPLLGAVAAHALLAAPFASHAADGSATASAFVWLFCWIRMNRTALGHLEEPGRRPHAPVVRIVRSRQTHARAPRQEESPPPRAVILPYDFR